MWDITAAEKDKYRAIYESLQPAADGKLSGDQVKPVLMKSNLDVNKLGQIWVLSDIDQDGMLNEHEFTVAMHLTYKALAGTPLPDQLPLELQTRKFYFLSSYFKTQVVCGLLNGINTKYCKRKTQK